MSGVKGYGARRVPAELPQSVRHSSPGYSYYTFQHVFSADAARPSTPASGYSSSGAPPAMTDVLGYPKSTIPVLLSAFELGTGSQVFKDTMAVRIPVFVEELPFPAEGELDGDDARSFHIVAYEADGSGKTSPAATIRVIPAQRPRRNGVPQAMHIELGTASDTERLSGTRPCQTINQYGNEVRK